MTVERFPLLAAVDSPAAVRRLPENQLTALAAEIREVIIQTVATNGGHLAPSLGVVELTIALLRVFDPLVDRIVWDVGHQAYAYKLLTGRLPQFHTLRQKGGISGFPRPDESPFDHFAVGHSSTSISAALGMAVARDLAGKPHKTVAVIGDGSMTAGLAYEGLNQAGGLGRDLIVVLNDNEMSISRNVGALSSFLSRKLSKRWVQRFKREVEAVMRQVPVIGDDLAEYARRTEDSLKSFFTPGMLFEAFRFSYIGPIQGHDVRMLERVLAQAATLEGPILVHVLTKKGKGYAPAEANPVYFHGVGCFEPETGMARKFAPCALPSYTDVFGQTLCRLAGEDARIVAITAAMPEGTGLTEFARRFPERFFDVGICEQHAVTFAAGLASQGLRPVVAIYSTFLQRSYDQIVHDVCLQNLPVVLCLDRAGLVGEDGPTHHGVFDLAYLRHIPNLTLMAPRSEPELQRMLVTAFALGTPVAVRYPRGVGSGEALVDDPTPIAVGEGELLRPGTDALVIAVGSRVLPALAAAHFLAEEDGRSVAVFDARFVKPLAEQQIVELGAQHRRILIAEEGCLMGGFGSAVLELLADRDLLHGRRVRRLGVPDRFVGHGTQDELRHDLGLTKSGILSALRKLMHN
ncbi:MAG TPA: 1-deoxy-D-xylulose-5-phosphate synthase [Desulfomicrobiaceae bacterium]|nr:1-deoxy-D-xylulose-5-phosphate synthase [Desulfomicrobiaceae bacterium]